METKLTRKTTCALPLARDCAPYLISENLTIPIPTDHRIGPSPPKTDGPAAGLSRYRKLQGFTKTVRGGR
jgi:hypothetical protein